MPGIQIRFNIRKHLLMKQTQGVQKTRLMVYKRKKSPNAEKAHGRSSKPICDKIFQDFSCFYFVTLLFSMCGFYHTFQDDTFQARGKREDGENCIFSLSPSPPTPLSRLFWKFMHFAYISLIRTTSSATVNCKCG